MRFLSLFLISALLIYTPAELFARDYLLDDWRFGSWQLDRHEIEESGVQPVLILTVDYAKPVAGGSDHEPAAMGNADFVVDIDAEKSLGWRGAEFFLYVLGNHYHTSGQGEFLTDKIGNAQVTSNIEAPSAVKIYEFWYDQTFLSAESGQSWSIRTGLYDLNSEFDVIESAAGLVNSSFGIGADFSQSGENGPSIFPVTSLALRLLYRSDGGAYAQIALLDGVPGDPGNERGTHVKLGGGDGVLQVVEAGWVRELAEAQRYRKIAIGLWRYNPEQAEIVTNDDEAVQTSHSQGYYLIGEYQLLQESSDPAQGLAVFLRYGRADGNINPIKSYSGVGASYVGLVDGRDADQLSMGIAIASFGGEFADAELAMGNEIESREWIYEISYRLQLAPWFALQPDLQRVRNPVAGNGDVTVALLRAEVVF